MKFETAVDEIITRTDDVKSFRFPRPADFSYKAGQFIMVSVMSGETKLTKPMSISSSPTEKNYMEFTKKISDHSFSKTLDALTVGGWVGVEGPYGSFTLESEYEKIGMLSGGVGLTPLISILRYCTDMNLNVNIVMLYGNRTERNIIFKDDFEQMQKQNKNIKIALTLDDPQEGWTGEKGNINADMLKRILPDYQERVFFICGPPGMVQAMTGLLRSLSIPDDQIKLENFAGY
jgi:glycine betaine catabolism B